MVVKPESLSTETTMKTRPKLLIAGRSKDAITALQKHLQSHTDKDVQVRHIVNGHADPLHGLTDLPELLILHVNGLEGGELEALLERPAAVRPPIVVISETDDAAAMRFAMKAGARDFLLHSEITEVVQSVNTICSELTEQVSSDGQMTAVVNAKGGAGATFLACNLAHLAASVTDEPTALIGLDMQFPTLPSYFDLKLKHGLLRALESAHELDAVALDAIMASHSSGLKILAAKPENFRFSFDPLVEQATPLFDLLLDNYKHIVVDMPRNIDEFNAQIISRASRIVMVVQQSLPHIQDATRWQQLLRDQLGISSDNLLVVVNRYDKRAEIQLADIEKALPDAEIVTVPNQYKEVSESINLGIPMYEYARNSAVSRALIALQSRVFGHANMADTAAASGRISSFLQKSPLHQLFGDK
jgi:pilus assembly protein CpaE